MRGKGASARALPNLVIHQAHHQMMVVVTRGDARPAAAAAAAAAAADAGVQQKNSSVHRSSLALNPMLKLIENARVFAADGGTAAVRALLHIAHTQIVTL